MAEIQNLTFHFGKQAVLNNFTLSLPPKGLIAISGPSGSGKTTLFRILAGLLKPEAGKVSWAVQRPGVLFQEDRLLPWLTALENAALGSGRAAALHWLSFLELGEHAQKYPAELSGGMKRRVSIARALAFNGDALLLDEPLKGLDARLQGICLDIFAQEARQKPVIMISHTPAELERADERLYFTGPPLCVKGKESG